MEHYCTFILQLLDYLSNKQYLLIPYAFINLHYLILTVLKYTISDRQVSYTEDSKEL